jgi:hypothetical protein
VHVPAEAARCICGSEQAVFDVLSDAGSYARWVRWTRDVRAAEASWPRVGSRLWHHFGRWPLRSAGVTEVVACRRPSRLVLRADVSPHALVYVTITVSACAGGDRCLVRIREDMTRGWLRRFAVHAESIRSHFARLAAALDPQLAAVEPAGSALADAVAAIGAAARAASLRLATASPWRLAARFSGGLLLAPNSINTS